MGKIKGTVWHYTAGPWGQTVQDIIKFHQASPKNWRTIGYNYLILDPIGRKNQDGKLPDTVGELIKIGRSIDDDLFLDGDEIGAHSRGSNSTFIGACFVCPAGEDIHPMQKEAGKHLLNTLTPRHEYPVDMNIGHGDVYSTECPGPFVRKWLEQTIQEYKDFSNDIELTPDLVESDYIILDIERIMRELQNTKDKRIEELLK